MAIFKLAYRASGIILLVSLAINGLTWLAADRISAESSVTTILHYSADFGIDYIGDSSTVTVLPKVGLILLMFNLLLGLSILKVEPRASWVLIVSTPFLQMGMLVALFLIWRINQ